MKSAHQVFAGFEVDADFAATELSTCASKVVGAWTNGMPRK